METRTVDLNGGWAVTIRRPPLYLQTQWDEFREQVAIKRGEKRPPEAIQEQGRDPEPEVAFKIHPEHYQWWEETLLKAAVVSVKRPDGSEGKEVYIPDLGVTRFGRLLEAVFAFVNEAEESFRGDGGGDLADVGASSDAASAGAGA
jgi:hypothetical protein